MPGFTTDGLPRVSNTVTTPNYPQLSTTALIAADTLLTSGEQPQSVAATIFQVAAIAAACGGSASTESGGAVTSNVKHGLITTAALTTVVGSTYTCTLTNSTVTAASTVQAAMYSKSNTAASAFQLTSVTPAAGSVVLVFTNNGTATANGTFFVPFTVSV